LDEVGLGPIADRTAVLCPGGERQRIAIARALVKQPSLVITDEPTGALDQANGRVVLDLLLEIVDRGSTLVLVTHDLAAAERADRTVTIVDGRIDHGG
jgi:putative ABC transport system ATP-binding protein